MHTWRDAFDARDTTGADKLFDAIPASSGEIRLVASPIQYIDGFGTWHKGPFALAVTTFGVVMMKSKALGGVRVDSEIPIRNFRRYSVGPFQGGPMYEVYEELSVGGTLTLLFLTLDAAEAVAEYINSGVAMAGPE